MSWSSSEAGISAYFVLYAGLLALVLVLSKFLHEYPRVASILPEAGMILLVGMFAGSIVYLLLDHADESGNDDQVDSVAQSLLSFSPPVFFIALLPPIIFNSGYHLRTELFFRHITPIALFAVVGTFISAITIAFLLEIVTSVGLTGGFNPALTELLAFGALISVTDPVSTLTMFQAKRVDPQLFYLVFGESVLNDAVGLVLFQTFRSFVIGDNGAGKVILKMGQFLLSFSVASLGSPILGLVCACGAALLFKHINMSQHKLLELSLYVLIMYVPFLLAELIQLSGIVTILFTGMAARAYVVPNLSDQTTEYAETFFRLAAHLAETCIFLDLGLSVFGMTGSLNGRFVMWTLLACIIGRAANVYPIQYMFNKRLRELPETDEEEREQLRNRGLQFPSRGPPQKLFLNEEERRQTLELSDTLHDSTDETREDAINDTNQKYHPPMSLSRQETDLSSLTHTPRPRRDLRIRNNTAHMLCFSGLRGAVAYACARSFPDTFGHASEFIVTTMVVVLVTVFTLGSATELMLGLLQINMDVDEDKYMEDWHKERRSAGVVRDVDNFIHYHVVRGAKYEKSTSEIFCAESTLKNESPGNHHSLSQPPGRDCVSSSLPQDYQPYVEMSEAEHLANLSGDLEKQDSQRRRTSLFDYGGGN